MKTNTNEKVQAKETVRDQHYDAVLGGLGLCVGQTSDI